MSHIANVNYDFTTTLYPFLWLKLIHVLEVLILRQWTQGDPSVSSSKFVWGVRGQVKSLSGSSHQYKKHHRVIQGLVDYVLYMDIDWLVLVGSRRSVCVSECVYQSQNNKGCEILPSLHVWCRLTFITALIQHPFICCTRSENRIIDVRKKC